MGAEAGSVICEPSSKSSRPFPRLAARKVGFIYLPIKGSKQVSRQAGKGITDEC